MRARSLLLLAIFLAAAAGCARLRSLGRPSGVPATLRAGISDNYPPLAFNQDGHLAGIEVDFAAALQKEWGSTVQIVPTPWEDLIPDLLANRIDVIMSGMSITPERAQQVRFTESYLEVGQMFLIRREVIGRLSSPSQLVSTEWRVAVIAGTTGAAYGRDHLPQSIIVPYTSVDDAVAAVRSSEVDLFIHDAPTIWRFTADPAHVDEELIGIYQSLTDERLAWAVRPADTALLQALNAVLNEWKTNGRLGEIESRWIRTSIEVQ